MWFMIFGWMVPVAITVVAGMWLVGFVRRTLARSPAHGTAGAAYPSGGHGGHDSPAPFSREALGAVIKLYLLMCVFLVGVFVYHRLNKNHPDGWYLFLRMNAAPAFWIFTLTFWVSRWIRPSLTGLADLVAFAMAILVLDYLAAGYEDKFIGPVIEALPGGTVLFPYQFRDGPRKPVAPEDYIPLDERSDPPPEEEIWTMPPLPLKPPHP